MTNDRQLVVTENVSSNGVIEFLDPWFDPGDQSDTDDLNEVMRRQMASETALVLGRQTFEDFRGYWPRQTDDETGSTEHLNRVQKYVASFTLTDPGWANTTVVPRSPVDAVRELKSSGAGEIGVTGSISVVHALFAADVVDELRLFVYPVLTSRGRNLLPDGLAMQSLSLVHTQAFRGGVVLLTYRRRRTQ